MEKSGKNGPERMDDSQTPVTNDEEQLKSKGLEHCFSVRFTLMNVNLSSYTSCFRCGGVDLVLDYKAGDIICRECGEVINDRVIDEGNEVKFYMNDDDPHKTSRTSGFSESIGSLQTSFITNSESVKRTLERAQRFSSDKKELQALAHMNTVSEMCSKMNLIAPIKNRAIEVFTQTILGRVVTSKSKEPIAAACVYLACRMENYPRTLDEVSFATGLDVRVISKMQQAIARKLQLSIGRLRPHHLVNRFAAKLKCPHTLGALSQEICLNITRLELLETHAPQLVAAGSIVIAGLVENHPLDISALSAVAVVTVSSMKLMYRNILPVLTLVVPKAAQILAESRGRPLSDFPASLEKIMAGELLIVKEPVKVEEITGKESVDVAAAALTPAQTSVAPEETEEPAADAALEDIICTLVEPVPARPSANNLTLLLGQCAELQLSPRGECSVASPGSRNVSDSPGPDCAAEKPPSPSALKRAHGEAAVAGEVRIAVETRVSTPPAGAVTAARDAEGVVEESISDPEEDFSPLRKVRKVAMSKG